MGKILFVCYVHGCRGEFLSKRISSHPMFKTLTSKQINGRTVITNDYFNKKFLISRSPSEEQMKQMEKPDKDNIVVPSHRFYGRLKNYFPDASFVSIDMPKDIEAYKKALFDRYYLYKTKDLLELVGECESSIRIYQPEASVEDIKNFTIQVLKAKDVDFGDIRCMAQGVESTLENKMKFLDEQPLYPLSEETRNNSLVIPFEDVDNFNINTVVNHFVK